MQNHSYREIFTTYLTSECQNFQNLDDKCKLIWILNNEDPTILRYLCQYLLSTTIWLNGIGDLQTGWPALSMRKKIFFLASSLDARCWLSKSSDPFPCSKQYYMLCVPPISFHIKILLYQHGRSALDTSRTLFPFSIDSRCLLQIGDESITWYMYMFSLTPRPHIYVSKCVCVYVHISLFLPKCACRRVAPYTPTRSCVHIGVL